MADTDIERKSARTLRRNRAAYEAAQKQLDTPMTLLALVLGILLAVQFLYDLDESTNQTFELVGWLIWAIFVVEYLVLLWLAPSRKEMMRTHKLDLFLILVPFFRPLRALRVLRMFAGFGAAFVMGRRIIARRGLQWILLSVVFVIVVGAALTLMAERQDPAASITDFGTAIWWAVVTSTTVGYGDVSPVTPLGRGIAVMLMIVGIALLSVITANVASLFLEQDVQDENDELREELQAVNAKLDLLLGTAINLNGAAAAVDVEPTTLASNAPASEMPDVVGNTYT